jgi:hypothetical protein
MHTATCSRRHSYHNPTLPIEQEPEPPLSMASGWQGGRERTLPRLKSSQVAFSAGKVIDISADLCSAAGESQHR